MSYAQIATPAPIEQRIGRFAHILLQTGKYKESVDFYKTLLSANAMFENETACFMSYDDEHHRVVILNKPDAVAKDPNAAGVGHFAYAFDTLHDLLINFKRLKEDHGLSPAYCVNHGFMTSFYYLDPDGIEVELGVDCFPNNDATNDWFSTGAFDNNFFGFFCDPEYMLKRHLEGASDSLVFEETYRDNDVKP